jgi:serine/threonine protein kinase
LPPAKKCYPLNSQFELESSPSEKVEKSSASRTLLATSLKEHFLFSNLSDAHLSGCIDVMRPCEIQAGADIITQGDSGTVFYVLESGEADVLVNGTKVAGYKSGGSFGELALMYNAQRAATVRAVVACHLWTMDLRTFRQLLATAASGTIVRRCEFLRKVPLLEPLSNEQITKLADALEEKSYSEGEYIIKQGEQGETFYIIESGEVRCTQWKSPTDQTEVPLLMLKEGDYFGEMALMLDEPRAAHCIASSGPIKCLTLERTQFFSLLGSIQTILQNNMRLRILKSVPILANLTDGELCAVADALFVQSFEAGDYIIRQGEHGSRFYMINEGEAKVVSHSEGHVDGMDIMKLGKGDYFGERALLKNEGRGADVIAEGFVDCLVLERDDFNRLLGPLENILARDMKSREQQGKDILRAEAPRTVARSEISLDSLERLKTLGTGTFGRVRLVRHKETGECFALKCMMKAQIAKSHQQRNILNEKNLLLQCEHPFIMDLIFTYNTQDELLMLTELLQGGELWTYIYEKTSLIPRTSIKGFVPSAALFYAGCVVLALQYLHQSGIAYRDLKPENLLVSLDGYLKVIDFGFAKRIPFKKGRSVQTKSFTLCGTPDYLAPELVLSRGHDKSVDYWALGCFTYELLVGKTPFADPRQAEIFKKAIRSDTSLQFPSGFDPGAVDLVRKLLKSNPSYRLGNLSGGARDIMEHAWFRDAKFDWQKLYRKELKPPYIPSVKDVTDTSHFDKVAENDRVTPYTGSQKIFEGF